MAEVMLSTSSYIWVAKGSGAGNLTYEVGYWRAYSGGEVKFKVESRWTDKESAAHRVSFLNGGHPVPPWMMENMIDETEGYISPDEATKKLLEQNNRDEG